MVDYLWFTSWVSTARLSALAAPPDWGLLLVFTYEELTNIFVCLFLIIFPANSISETYIQVFLFDAHSRNNHFAQCLRVFCQSIIIIGGDYQRNFFLYIPVRDYQNGSLRSIQREIPVNIRNSTIAGSFNQHTCTNNWLSFRVDYCSL